MATTSTHKPLNESVLLIVFCASLAYSTMDSVGFAPGTYTVLPFGIATVLGPTTTVLPPVTIVFGGSTTVVAAAVEGARPMVDSPMTTADADSWSEMGVPDTVMGVPPGTSVWLTMMKTDEGPATITEPPSVMTGAGFSGTMAGCVGVALLLTRIVVVLGASETVVPESVMAGPPGTNVWLSMTNAEVVFAVMTVVPMTTGGGGEFTDTAVLLSTIVVLAVEVTNIVLPEIVETGETVTFATFELVVSTRVEAEDPEDRETEDGLEVGDSWVLEGEEVGGEVDDEEGDAEGDAESEEVGEEELGGMDEEEGAEEGEEEGAEEGEEEGGDRITVEVDTPDEVDDVDDWPEAVVSVDDVDGVLVVDVVVDGVAVDDIVEEGVVVTNVIVDRTVVVDEAVIVVVAGEVVVDGVAVDTIVVLLDDVVVSGIVVVGNEVVDGGVVTVVTVSGPVV